MTDVPTRSHAHLHEHGQSEQSAGHSHHGRSSEPGAQGGSDLKDPVCGMSVTSDSPHRSSMAERRTTSAARAVCRSSAPIRRIRTGRDVGLDTGHRHQPFHARRPGAAAAAGTIYTCPMHPQVRQPTPGNCPICGMALEPEMPALDDGPIQEYVDFRRRFWWTLPLTLIVAVVAMFNADFDGSIRPCSPGSSWCWRRRSCGGRAGRSSSAGGSPWSVAARTCGR